jgi:hypothetical protein
MSLVTKDLAERLVPSAYANWTDDGWNVRVHGNVYKLPNVSQDKIDDLANVFLIDTDVEDLDESEKAQARNVTRSIFVVQQDDRNVTIDFVQNVDIDSDENGGAINAVSKDQAGPDQPGGASALEPS